MAVPTSRCLAVPLGRVSSATRASRGVRTTSASTAKGPRVSVRHVATYGGRAEFMSGRGNQRRVYVWHLDDPVALERFEIGTKLSSEQKIKRGRQSGDWTCRVRALQARNRLKSGARTKCRPGVPTKAVRRGEEQFQRGRTSGRRRSAWSSGSAVVAS